MIDRANLRRINRRLDRIRLGKRQRAAWTTPAYRRIEQPIETFEPEREG